MIELLSVLGMSSGSSAATGIVGLFSAMMAAFYGAFMLLYCVIILFALITFVFWIWMLIDALSRKNYDTENERLLWCLVVFLGHWLGALIYFFLVKKKKDPPTSSVSATKPEVKPATTVKPEVKK